MKQLICLFFVALMVAACAEKIPIHMEGDSFAFIEQHCREHARDMVGEADEESRYRECMAHHGFDNIIETDEHLTGAH